MSIATRPRFTISKGESTDLWVARDEETGTVSQGADPTEALDNLQEALTLYHEPDLDGTDLAEPSAPWFE